jgi:hypothetical protein
MKTCVELHRHHTSAAPDNDEVDRITGGQLVGFLRAACLQATVDLDFQPVPPNMAKSSFLEDQNGWV